MPPLHTYLRLLSYARPHGGVFLLAIAAMVVLALSEAGLPAIMKPMLDGSFVKKDPDIIRWVPIALVALFIVRGIAGFASSYAMAYIGNHVVADLRREMFEKLLAQPMAYYDNTPRGNLVATVAYNVSQLTMAATVVLTTLVKDTLSIAVLIGWLLYLNWKLTLVTLILAPAALLIFRLASQRLRHTSREIQKNVGNLTQILEESIGGQKIIKIFDAQGYERERFGAATQYGRRYAMKQAAAAEAHGPIIQLLAAIALAIIVYIATLQVGADETTVGGFMSYMVAMLLLSGPLKRLSAITVHLQRGLAAAESVFDLLDRDVERDTGTYMLDRARGEVRFEQVTLTYVDKHTPALEAIDLTIRPGETLALVGGSGSGKSSLVNLLPRFYEPNAGRILLDGIDLRDIRLASLRRNIALVSQEITLFNDSVAANIAYGRQDTVSRETIRRAAEAANALGFIEELPQGFDTLIGENGVKLSGGQRQRLAIARAILKDAPILILDEATSALDTESERLVQAALDNLMHGRTTLVIAHRLSTVENAHRIVVLEKGHVVEVGPHAELLARHGAYSRLHALQFNEGTAEPA